MILILERYDGLRRLWTKMLEKKSGIKILWANSVEEAEKIFENDSESEIEVMVADSCPENIGESHMDIAPLAKKVHEKHPEMPIIMCKCNKNIGESCQYYEMKDAKDIPETIMASLR